MSNRWRQGLYNKLENRREELEQKEELTYRELLQKEEIDEIEKELDDTPAMTEDEYREFEQRINKVTN